LFNPLADELIQVDIGNDLWLKIKVELSEGEWRKLQRFYLNLFDSPKVQQAIRIVTEGRRLGKEASAIESEVESLGLTSAITQGALVKITEGQSIAYVMAGLREWNLTGNDGKVLPITEDTLLGLKRPVFQAIADACTKQYRPMDDGQKNSLKPTSETPAP